LEGPTVLKSNRDYPAFYGTRRFTRKVPPLVHVRIQTNRVNTAPFNLSRSILILFIYHFPTNSLYTFLPLPFVLHKLYHSNYTNILLIILHPSLVEISSSTPCYQKLSVHVLPLMYRPRFTPSHRKNYRLIYSNF
jgi:hypothetical protein